jgi:hypothetical protein
MPIALSRLTSAEYVSQTLFRKDLRGGATVYRPFSFVTLQFRTLLTRLLLVDAAFILLNILAVLAFKAHLIAEVPDLLKVTHDLTLPEDFNYLKWGTIALALFWMAYRDRWLTPFLWGIVFVMILLDDSIQIHEMLGHDISVAERLPSTSLLYADDLGELIVFGLMGLIALGIAVTSFSQKGATSRKMTIRYICIVCGLAFFAVGLDALHQMVVQATIGTALETILPQVMGLLEDGGEMVVGSLALAITLAADPVALRGNSSAETQSREKA